MTQPPYVPGQPQQPDTYWSPQPEPKRPTRWPWIAVAFAAILLVGGGGWLVYSRVIKTDAGVVACEAMRDNAKKAPAGKAAQLTEAEYRQVRGQFEESRYDDIRTHGTSLVDLAWQIQKLGKDPGMAALAYLGPLTEHATGLQTACANQGVMLDLNLAGNNGATTDGAAPSKPATPSCAEVFKPGKVIDEDKAAAGCTDSSGGMTFVGAFDCPDGRKLFQVDANTGAPAGWGFGGSKYRATKEAASDPAYGKAVSACTG